MLIAVIILALITVLLLVISLVHVNEIERRNRRIAQLQKVQMAYSAELSEYIMFFYRLQSLSEIDDEEFNRWVKARIEQQHVLRSQLIML